jgi:subtilisin-like proprotein convertase family protein
MQTLKQVLVPMLATLAALVILAGSYYFAKSGIPTPPADVPITPITVLGGPATRDPMGSFLTPTGVERGADGRYISQDSRQIIPDNNLRRGAISRINVPDHITIQTVKVVNLEVTHADTGELVVQLLSPDLALHTLVDGVCPGHANWLALTLDDASRKPLGSECLDNLNDAYAPLEGNRLSAFNGGDAQGQWVLTVKDKKAGNIGYLEGWSLLFNTAFGQSGTPQATPTDATGTTPPNGTGTPPVTPTVTPATGGTTLTATPLGAALPTSPPLSFDGTVPSSAPTASPTGEIQADESLAATPTEVPLVYYP